MTQGNVVFSKYNPSGNMTVLVHSTHPESHYVNIANQLMATEHICCEQVGFIEKGHHDKLKLVMSGHEFCGNATISFLHYLKTQQLLPSHQVDVEVSGRQDLVSCKVHHDNSYEVTMPSQKQITSTKLNMKDQVLSAKRIEYDSYLHFVVPVQHINEEMKQAVEQFIQKTKWDVRFKTVGVMLYQHHNDYMEPFIYVPSISSMIWEQSCASGTASVGAYIHHQTGQSCHYRQISQPGGILSVSTKQNHNAYHTTIKGHVTTVATGTAYIE
ncbi:histidine racemase CntK [Staphylococcus felis]|uniref:histidine racemase CntK n=1 Tax=Staphylococcus felis TaxID=46127 RepID=UPI003967BC39